MSGLRRKLAVFGSYFHSILRVSFLSATVGIMFDTSSFPVFARRPVDGIRPAGGVWIGQGTGEPGGYVRALFAGRPMGIAPRQAGGSCA